MKQTVYFWKTAKWGRRQEAFLRQRMKKKKKTNRKYLLG